MRILLIFNTCYEKIEFLKSVQCGSFFPFSMSCILKMEVTLSDELCIFVRDLQSVIFAQKEVLLLKYSPRRTLPNGNS